MIEKIGPTIHKGENIYKTGSGVGGGGKFAIDLLIWYGGINIPNDIIEFGYEIEEKPSFAQYYIGGGCAAPCKTSGIENLVVFAADSLDDVTTNYCSYVTDWDASSWGFSRFYAFSCTELQNYPIKVKGVFGNNNFKLYINDKLIFEISSNKINPEIWNRYRNFYCGPISGDYVQNNRFYMKNFYFK